MAEPTNLDFLKRFAVIVTNFINDKRPDRKGIHIKLSELFVNDMDVMMWFRAFFKFANRNIWLVDKCKISIVSSSANKQFFLTDESTIVAGMFHSLSNLDDVYVRHIPANVPEPDAVQGTISVIGTRKAWVDMESETQAKAVHHILPDVEAAVKSHLLANIHGELGAVLMAVAYAIEKKEGQIIDKENRMRVEGASRVVQGLVSSYINAKPRYITHLFSLYHFFFVSSPNLCFIPLTLSCSSYCTISSVLSQEMSER